MERPGEAAATVAVATPQKTRRSRALQTPQQFEGISGALSAWLNYLDVGGRRRFEDAPRRRPSLGGFLDFPYHLLLLRESDVSPPARLGDVGETPFREKAADTALCRQPATRRFGSGVWHDASLAVDPLNPRAYRRKGFIHYLMRDDHRAELAFRKSLAIVPTFAWEHHNIGEILLLRGDREAALREMQAEAHPGARDAGLALAYYALGRKAESDAALTRYIAEFPYSPCIVALIHAYRGERDPAFEWLGKAYTERDPDLFLWLKDHPFLDSLRTDDRYKALLRRLNLSA